MEYIVLALLLIITLKQVYYIKKLIIKTYKEKLEMIFLSIFIIAILTITFIFASKTIHYIICVVGLIAFFLNWYKQGITSKGIIIVARGKEFYEWSEIKNAEIENLDYVTEITFIKPTGSKIVTHTFSKNNYDKIIDIFKRHDLKYKIKKANIKAN